MMDLPTSGAVRDVCFSMCSRECLESLWAISALTSDVTASGPDTAVTKTTFMSYAAVDPDCVHFCKTEDKQLN